MQESAGSDGSDSGGGSPSPGELSLVGLDRTDPSCLLLSTPDGATFRLRADSALRSALRSLGPATGALTAAPAPLRPREIQARIRAGESAADVAADAGVPVEQVRRYEGPVLAERAHIAERARSARVRGEGERPRLADVVRVRLAGRGVDPASVAWDAWRRDEGRWSVMAAFRVAGRDKHAQWLFEPRSQALEPMDDEARWLCAVQDTAPRTGRRLAAVRVYGVEDDGELREIPDPGTGTGPAAGPAAGGGPALAAEPLPTADPQDVAARTMELLDALRDRRGRRVPMMDLDDDESWGEDDEDEYLNALLDLPPAAHPPAGSGGFGGFGDTADADQDSVVAPEPPRLRMLRAAVTGEIPVVPTDAAGGDDSDSGADTVDREQARGEAAPAPSERRRDSRDARAARHVQAAASDDDEDDDAPLSRGRRRPSVPSWDEILFGSPRLD